ncbi:MAG: nucleoid-associated protein [Nocardioides sp.]|nr:nucleoid-associated protein [Nocardioides sp.]
MSQTPDPQNPLEALTGGGFDFNAIIDQAQQMQAGIEEAQRGLTEARIEGSVAGGAVSVTVDGTGELVGVEVRPGTVDGDDAESLSDFSDLIVAAYRDAKAKADEQAAQAFGPLAGGLGGLGGLGGGLGGLSGGGERPPGKLGF